MTQSLTGNRFYQFMGIVLLALVITGFASTALIRSQSPFELPLTFHLHAFAFLAWFSLYLFQVSLIGNNNRALHRKLGQFSVVLVVAMVITGLLMAQHAFDRGTSPIPDMSVQQFMSFPLFDLFGLLVFYCLAMAKRFDAEFHKRAILFTSIAIMDPATARIGFALEFPPFPLVASLLLVGAVIWHDRKVLSRVHIITWFGLFWVFLRVGFVFGVASSEGWAKLANSLFA